MCWHLVVVAGFVCAWYKYAYKIYFMLYKTMTRNSYTGCVKVYNLSSHKFILQQTRQSCRIHIPS